MNFTRKFKKFFAILCILAWMHLDVYTVYAAASAMKNMTAAVHSYAAISSDPAERVGNLFDQNIHTDYILPEAAFTDVNLDTAQKISEIRIYGSASYLLTVQEQINGQWQNIPSLNDLNLSTSDNNQWNTYKLQQSLETDKLRFRIIPTETAQKIKGIREIEIRTSESSVPILSGNAVLALTDSGAEAEDGRQYSAEPQSGIIGSDEGEYLDSDEDNVFHFDMVYSPDQIRRAYLTYELSGLSHWTAAVRSVNDQAAMGGYVIERGEGGLQTEEISPSWLKQGTNKIRFAAISPNEEYDIRNVRMKIERNDTSDTSENEYPAITVTYPDSGQYFGDQVYIRGFVTADNGSGEAKLSVGAQEIRHINGEFETLAETKLADKDGNIELTAVYPDGEILNYSLSLEKDRLEENSDIEIRQNRSDKDEDASDENGNSGQTSVNGNLKKNFDAAPDKDDKFDFEGAGIEMSKGALRKAVKLGMMTLLERDLPALDPGMVNVTGKHKGYRFLPHGMKFDKKVKVKLPYKKSLIPNGFKDQDVQTYFFDEASGRWVPLVREGIDTAKAEVTSQTDHFTDMINAVVQVPESPEAASFNPTQIKDIKVANPAAKVNLIEPPQANNQGDARLSYPIEVPPGRRGMQPQLGIQYSSGGGNGWMGLGWDLPVQSVSIDTRWGVPRYDAGKETETYLLNGEQLTPLAHRGALESRSGEKIFHTRTEGAFQKIIRHGSSPANYWWEVIDKNGTRYFYGGTYDTGGSSDEYTLTDDQGNVAKWALARVWDTNANTIDYEYVRQEDTGLDAGILMGSELYLKNIFYTGHGVQKGPYRVTFIRDRELNEAKRADVTIDARFGFKKVTADLLRKIEVRYQTDLIRSYEFGYQEGAFKKTLLKSVTQLDNEGQAFNKHEFEYFDEARVKGGGYYGFGQSQTWDTGNDNVNAGLIFHGEASAIGGNQSSGYGGHLYVGLALGGCQKKVSLGGKIGFSKSNSKGLLALTDVNGDGLPDKVFRSGGAFRPNRSGPDGIPSFGDSVGIGLGGISREKSDMFSYGAELYLGASIGINRSNSFSESDTYLSDVNGDGIIDLVRGGSVRFGLPDDADKTMPVPLYSSNSSQTPYPIGPGAVDAEGLLEDFKEIYEEMLKASPLHDTLRCWTAPFDGQVSISGDVSLVEDTSDERAEYKTADGVRAAIQNNGSELWAKEIKASDYSPKTPQGVDLIRVEKGDRIYFRVQSGFDGAYDQVLWTPQITYLNVDAATDPDGFNPYIYQAATDFIPTGRTGMSVTLPVTGSVQLSGDVEKLAPLSDDIKVVVLLNDTEMFSRTSDSGNAETIPVNLTMSVNQEDQLKLEIEADSPVDLTQIQWKPHLEYLSANGMNSVYDAEGNPAIVFDPPYLADVYGDNDLNTPLKAWVAPQSGNVTVSSSITTTEDSGTVFLTVKRVNELLGKKSIDVSQSASANLTVTVTKGDKLYFGFSTRDRSLAESITSYSISVGGVTVPAALYFPAEEGFFGQPFRGWTYCGYKGDGDRAKQPIIESDLAMPEVDQSQLEEQSKITDPEKLDPQFSPEKSNGIPFYPEPGLNRWRGYDDGTWVSAGVQSSSRLGMDFPSVPKSGNYAGASAVSRLSKSKQTGVFAGIGPASVSTTKGESEGILDFIDMNGDRFPDVVSKNSIQYSPMTGGLEGKSRGAHSGIRKSETQAFSAGMGGTVAHTESNARGNAKSSGEQMASFGLSGNFGTSKDERNYDFNDVNGDGLPDKVYDDGSTALNLGYKFGPKEHWGDVRVDRGEGMNLSVGASPSFNDGLYGFGGGLSLSESISESKEAWLDINGDGLPDYVRKSGGVALNTGNGFAGISYPGAGDFSENVSTDQSGGLYFTIMIPLGLLPICIIINPGAEINKGIGRPKIAIMDIDGDGYPDHLKSDDDGSIEVRRNPIGRSNMLKTVHRPLGATITVAYERDGNTYQMPHSRWNMTRVEVSDGVSGDGVDTLLTTYQYEDGFYHRQERDFYGYRVVTTEQRNIAEGDALYRSTTQTFMNRNYYEKGLLISEVVQDAAGRKYVETENTYQLRDIDTGSLLQGDFKESLTATVFPEMIRTDKKFYEGEDAPSITTYQTYQYDSLGNVVHFFDAGDVGSGDDVESFIEYENYPGNYIVGKAKKIVVKSNGQVMRQREATIQAATGNLSQVRLSLGSGTAIHDMTYDVYGNITQQTGPSNKNGQRYSLSYTYDSSVNTYVVGVQDSFGYVSTAGYDLRWGEITDTTDINRQQMTYRYDSVGRAIGITGPYQQGKGRETLTFAYHPEAAPAWALTRHFDNYQQQSDPLETVLFIDGIKREIQSKKDGAISSGNANAQDEMIVSGHAKFDFAGRSIEQYYPVTESLGNQGNFNTNIDSIQPTRTVYDVMDRVLKTTIPDDTATTFDYGFGRDREGNVRFKTAVTDANGISKVTYKDVGEAITSVQEFNEGKTLWTSYQYDAMNQIVEVKDNAGNITTARYDLGGRRTHIDSPDMGLTESVYDNASNVVKKITANLRAKGQAIEYDYDYNRLKAIRYPEYTGNNISYTYGEPGAAYNRANRIVYVTDESGKEERFYGPLGETIKTVKYVTSETEGGSANAPEIYVTEYTYDTYNRLRQLIYPDGEVLTYLYNSGGLAQSVSGKKGDYVYPYLKALTYDKFEQRVYMEQSNGAQTAYAYNPLNRRLSDLNAKSKGKSFMELKYDYDAVGNVMKLDNLAAVNKPYEFGGETHYQFGYDDLYRLTTSSGDLKQTNAEHTYTLSMQYDSIHNIVSKAQQHIRTTEGDVPIEQKKTTYNYNYAYASSKPHAPTTIGDRTFTYDANGNQTGWQSTVDGTERKIFWDEENRIQVIVDNGHTMTYKYNDAGERVFKTGPQGETTYINQFYTVGNREGGSKHVFVGTTRIATKMVKKQENVTTDASDTDMLTDTATTKRSARKDKPDESSGDTAATTTTGNNGNGNGNGSDSAGGNPSPSGNANGLENGNNGKGCDGNTGVGCDGNKGDDTAAASTDTGGSSSTGTSTPPATDTSSQSGNNGNGNGNGSNSAGGNPDPVGNGYGLENGNSAGGNPSPSGNANGLSDSGTTSGGNSGGVSDNAGGNASGGNSGTTGGNADGGNNGGGSGGGSDNNGKIIYEPDVFYYHPNHLGSTAFVSDVKGDIYEHLEYFPFGETWVEEASDIHRVPYLFTSKELDRETGLYYFGARYYDPRTSVWQSPDPVLEALLIQERVAELSIKLSLYSYVQNRPILLVDPDGRDSYLFTVAGSNKAGDTGHTAFATDIYEFKGGKYVETGKLRFYDFYPAERSETIFNQKPSYKIEAVSKKELLDVKGKSSNKYTGILQINTGKTLEEKAASADSIYKKLSKGLTLKEGESSLYDGPPFNAASNACVNRGKEGVLASGLNVDGKGTVIFRNKKGEEVTQQQRLTPNGLYQGVLNQPGVSVIKDAGDKTKSSITLTLPW